MLISKSGSAGSEVAALPRLPFPNARFVSDPKLPSAEQQLLPKLGCYQVAQAANVG